MNLPLFLLLMALVLAFMVWVLSRVGAVIEAYVIVWFGWARWWYLLDVGEWA